jgi:hypothetical protein
MKRQSLVLLAVAFVAAGAAGCFKDPVSGLRGGPSTLSLTSTAVFVLTGDSLPVTATLLDNAGNVLAATGPTWTSTDPTVATVRTAWPPTTHLDSITPVPGDAYTKGVIKGVAVNGGVTTVTVTVRGVSASIRVVVMPALIPASNVSVTGAAVADTVFIAASAGPPPVPPDTVAYTAGDTLVVSGTGFLNFAPNVSAYAVTAGGKANGFAAYSTPQVAHFVFTGAAAGKIIVKGVQLASTSTAVDTIPVDSLVLGDTMVVARVRYRGTIAQVGDTVTLTATNGIHFLPSTLVMFGSDTAVLFDTTAGAKVLAHAAHTTTAATLKGVQLGSAKLDAITSTATPTVTAATFSYPGAIAQTGDTLTVTAAGPIAFDSLTRVTVGTTKDSIISFDATHLYVLAPTASTGAVSVKGANLGLARISSLATAATYTTTAATVPAASVTQSGDTLTVTGNAVFAVDSLATVAFGTTTPTVLQRGANSISVLLGSASYTGAVTVNNAKVGIARIASLKTSGSYTVNQASFLGTLTVAGDTMTITAPAGVTFDAQTGASFGASAAYVVSQNASTLTVISPAAYTGAVQVTKALLGTVRVPAMITPLATYTITKATLPAASISQAGDTLTVTGNAILTIDAQAVVKFGSTAPTVWKTGTNSISVIWGAAQYTGPVSVTNAAVGISRVATLTAAGPYTVNQASFTGTLAVVGDTITITAPAGVTFDASTGAQFGSSGAILLGSTASTLTALSPVTYSGSVQVTKALLGTVRVPAMLSTTTASITGSAFPAANVSVGGGLLGDTIVVTAPAGFTFDTATASPSTVIAGNTAIATSDTAWTLTRTTTRITAMAKRGGIGPVKVTNLIAGTGPSALHLAYLPTATNFTIDSINTVLPSTGFNGANGDAVAHAVTIPPSGDFVAYSTLNPGGSFDADYWSFTTTLPSAISAEIDWFGSGNPYSSGTNTPAYTDDLDVILCSATMACDESGDLFGFSGATTVQPQTGAFSPANAGTYYVGVFAFTASYAEVYKLLLSVY